MSSGFISLNLDNSLRLLVPGTKVVNQDNSLRLLVPGTGVNV